MNKIFFICIVSALLLAGCSSNSEKETESSSETITTVTTISTVATENSSEETEVTSESTTTVTDIDDGTELITTELTVNQSQESDFSGNTIRTEMPVINEENPEAELEIITTVMDDPKETVTTTIVENTEYDSVSTAVHDGVIELPFVPVR